MLAPVTVNVADSPVQIKLFVLVTDKLGKAYTVTVLTDVFELKQPSILVPVTL